MDGLQLKERSFGWTLFALTIVTNVLSYLLLALGIVTFTVEKPKHVGYGVFKAQWRRWFSKFTPFSITHGAVMILKPEDADSQQVLQHEGVHIRQFQVQALTGVFTMFAILMFDPHQAKAGVISLFLTPALIWLSNYTCSALLGHGSDASRKAKGLLKVPVWLLGVYRGTEVERSAYAQTDTLYSADQKSWLDRQS